MTRLLFCVCLFPGVISRTSRIWERSVLVISKKFLRQFWLILHTIRIIEIKKLDDTHWSALMKTFIDARKKNSVQKQGVPVKFFVTKGLRKEREGRQTKKRQQQSSIVSE